VPYILFLNIKTKSPSLFVEGGDLMDLSSPKRGWSDLSYREYTANTLKMAEYVVTID
jgi:hypothetical protein